MKRIFWLMSAVMLAGGGVLVTWASAPVGVVPTLLARGTYSAFNVKADNDFFKYRAKGWPELDMVVRMHDYAPGGSTGWHTHPGPVFITGVEGQLTFYEADDPTCTGRTLHAGEGYVDTGRGHIAINQDLANTAKDVSVILAPVGLPFRGELDAPQPQCGF